MAIEQTTEKEQKSSAPICGLCERPKVKRQGFGGSYECPNCSQSSGIGFGSK